MSPNSDFSDRSGIRHTSDLEDGRENAPPSTPSSFSARRNDTDVILDVSIPKWSAAAVPIGPIHSEGIANRSPALLQRHRQQVCSAFSLVELVLVVAIIGVLSMIALPRFGNSIAFQRVGAAARRIAADLDLARRRAVTTSTTQEVRFNAANDPGYTLVGLAHLDHNATEYFVSRTRDLDGAEAVSIDFGGDRVVIFDMYGKPDSGGSVQIRVGGSYRTISLDPETGRVETSG